MGESRHFAEIVLTLLAGAILFRLLKRAGFGVSDPAATPLERIADLMESINRREIAEGREPFCLVRAPRSGRVVIEAR